MEVAFGALTILILILAFKAQLQISLTTPCQKSYTMHEKEGLESDTDEPTAIDIGNIAADSMDAIPQFLSSIAAMAQGDGKHRHGSIHVLSLHVKLHFAVWLDCLPDGEVETFEDAWARSTGIHINMENVVIGGMACDGTAQESTVRLSLKYVGASSAAVVIPD